MIPVNNPIPEPEDFDEKCRKPGNRWLKSNIYNGHYDRSKRPANFWKNFSKLLAQGFSYRCGFLGTYVGQGTVDHWVSCNENPYLSYEWSNYRYLDGRINSSKNKCRAVIWLQNHPEKKKLSSTR